MLASKAYILEVILFQWWYIILPHMMCIFTGYTSTSIYLLFVFCMVPKMLQETSFSLLFGWLAASEMCQAFPLFLPEQSTWLNGNSFLPILIPCFNHVSCRD